MISVAFGDFNTTDTKSSTVLLIRILSVLTVMGGHVIEVAIAGVSSQPSFGWS